LDVSQHNKKNLAQVRDQKLLSPKTSQIRLRRFKSKWWRLLSKSAETKYEIVKRPLLPSPPQTHLRRKERLLRVRAPLNGGIQAQPKREAKSYLNKSLLLSEHYKIRSWPQIRIIGYLSFALE